MIGPGDRSKSRKVLLRAPLAFAQVGARIANGEGEFNGGGCLQARQNCSTEMVIIAAGK